jgi:hypothetical protein
MISFDLKMKLYCVKQTLKELQILLILSDKKKKKLCYISSTAALGDLAAHESIITEEVEWNQNPIVITPSLSMVPK